MSWLVHLSSAGLVALKRRNEHHTHRRPGRLIGILMYKCKTTPFFGSLRMRRAVITATTAPITISTISGLSARVVVTAQPVENLSCLNHDGSG